LLFAFVDFFYIAHFWPISKPYGVAKGLQMCNLRVRLTPQGSASGKMHAPR
jgi:hypothetical protein